jgi:hypothetical protein
MALKVEHRGDVVTTGSLNPKPQMCWTCKMRKTGLFDVDPNGDPRCSDCAAAQGQPIPQGRAPKVRPADV